MKRTITEIFIEIEETVAVLLTEKSAHFESESDKLTGGQTHCPFCGQPIPAAKNLQKENSKKKCQRYV